MEQDDNYDWWIRIELVVASSKQKTEPCKGLNLYNRYPSPDSNRVPSEYKTRNRLC